jgi:hypothetical protein
VLTLGEDLSLADEAVSKPAAAAAAATSCTKKNIVYNFVYI